MSTPGRPRALDEIRQREICALIAAGCTVREAARYVRCGRATIQREARRNADFQRKLDEALLTREIRPLQAMQQAAQTHWRAAAWMLERGRPERYGRRDPRAFRPHQARKLLSELLEIVAAEVDDPIVSHRLDQRIRQAIETAVPGTNVHRPTSRDIRNAKEFFAKKDARLRAEAEQDRSQHPATDDANPPGSRTANAEARPEPPKDPFICRQPRPPLPEGPMSTVTIMRPFGDPGPQNL